MTDEERTEEPKSTPESTTIEKQTTSLLNYVFSRSDGAVDPNLQDEDRKPNEDGFLDIHDNTGNLIGRISVQVKNLQHTNPPKHRTSVPTLYYHQVREEPFLLLGVNLEEDIGYWRYVTTEFVRELDLEKGQETARVYFPEENRIACDEERYIEDFREIVRENRAIYPKSRVNETKEAIEMLRHDDYPERAITKLSEEIDDAARSVLRVHGIEPDQFSKLRGRLKQEGFTNESVDKLYRGIKSVDRDVHREGFEEVDVDLDIFLEDGIQLLEYLYRQQSIQS